MIKTFFLLQPIHDEAITHRELILESLDEPYLLKTSLAKSSFEGSPTICCWGHHALADLVGFYGWEVKTKHDGGCSAADWPSAGPQPGYYSIRFALLGTAWRYRRPQNFDLNCGNQGIPMSSTVLWMYQILSKTSWNPNTRRFPAERHPYIINIALKLSCF